MPLSKIEVQHGNDELTFDGGMVTIGGRNGVDVVLRDAMVADRHCVITYEDGFVLRDTGSVTGTWVDGQRAAPLAELVDGATIVIGTTKLAVAVTTDDGTPTLQLTSEPQSFWWKKAGKGTFDNDPDQLVYSETRFGRFPTLKLSNRIAMITGAVVLLSATFLSSVMEPLADPGPLMPAHRVVTSASIDDPAIHVGLKKCVELSGEQGCNVCHTTGSGTPERKCAQCHGLEGKMAHEGSWRHPYHNDGTVSDQQFCVLCHTDHNGSTDRKHGSDELVGKCATCHGDDPKFDEKVNQARIVLPEQQPVAFEDLRFPHDAHLAQEIACDVCHQVDAAARAIADQSLPDKRELHDFASVRYEACASCHVAGADAVNMTAAQQAEWRTKAADAQWSVTWHGTSGEGSKCLACHAQADRGGATVIGPEMKTVTRGVFTADLYRQERALYTNATRSHAEQFEAHAGDKKCSECHLDQRVRTATPTSRPARPFWHGLHMAAGALAPGDAAGRISADNKQGCVSCHADLGQTGADHLTALDPDAAPYHWPDSPSAQAACKECHKEGEDLLPLRAAKLRTTAATEQRPDFPHDVHVMSAAFGQEGSLAKGCFACHEFSGPDGEAPFTQVPRTLASAMDCTSCHSGHAEIGGGDCQQCHPKIEGRSNSFLWQAKVAEPQSKRPWPARNGFSHLSEGHIKHLKDCATCHGDSGLDQAKALADVRVPDEREKLCRDCHLKEQFHWR
jgi:hypothetical protein